MADRKHWLLPEGVEEIVPPEAARLERLRRALLDLFATWGYRLVEPPLIEYVESLLTGSGRELDLHTFKLIDQANGRLLGVRADITPQAARIDARALHEEGPARLCYIGPVLHTLPDGFGGSRTPIQVGAEVFGHAGPESDVEVVTLMIETLRRAGVGPVQIDLGHVGIFRSLAHEARLDAEMEQRLFDALQRKARPEIEALVAEAAPAAPVAECLVRLADLNGGEDVLGEARALFASAGEPVRAALARLEVAAAMIVRRCPDTPVHYDLAELRGYGYKTGLVFAAFVPGHGREVARGGRYDEIGRAFGRARPATGFSTDLKTLLALGQGRASVETAPVVAPWSDDAGLARAVAELRASGACVVNELPGEVAKGTRRLVRSGTGWVVQGE